MRCFARSGFFLALAGFSCALLAAQSPYPQENQQPEPQPYPAQQPYAPQPAQPRAPIAINLQWTPPALEALRAQAAVANSFTLDRNMLAIVSNLLPDDTSGIRQSVNKLDGVSVNLFRFGPDGIPDESAVQAIRAAYQGPGWQHLVATSPARAAASSNLTDVWLLLDGINVRGAVVLEETPRSLSLVTVAGNLSPIDLLHLRGHFGIPRFNGDQLHAPTVQ